MRVARSIGPREVRIEDAPAPEAGPGDVICEVLACGVCASDVTDWYVANKVPTVLGHELAGVVRAVGDGATAADGSPIEPGARVVIHHHAPCGECRRCRRGHETLCDRFRATGLDPGGFAEHVRVPAELVGELLELPDSMDPIAATFIEPLACVLRAHDRAGLRAGDSLLVVGAGVNGLLQIAAAHCRAIDAVWVREPREARMELAEAYGAERHGNELVDVAIVCTPKPDAIAAAAAALAPGGTLCMYAPPAPDAPPPLDGTMLFLRELTVTASYSAGPADMRAAFELIASGEIDPLALVSHRLALDETGRALDLQRGGAALKVVVVP
ncbi:MAG: alcohol dehydrogenase catalytic domain-containing protein [Solirubrobacteraceae bacterium]